MRERVEAMRQLWTEDVAEYHGDLVNIEASWQWPKPIQKPHPPVFVAGASARVIERVARYGDGWLPVVVPEANEISPGRMTPIADLKTMVPRLNELATEAGRPRPRLVVSGYLDRESYETYETLGVESVTFRVPSDDIDSVRHAMDEIEGTIKASGGELSP
ncbi:MAG: LLM class flavin-dependent oxidoreductase [Pseudomonadales bacterium]|nr:LLM class flavin-dependent oxidoreductase [Pseudomonadales bacterium]